MKKIIKILAAIVFFALFVLTLNNLEVDFLVLGQGIGRLGELWSMAYPPNGSIFLIGLDGIWETIQIAFTGTFLGMIVSLPLGFLASRNLFSSGITWFFKMILAAIRTMPALLWAVLFVILVGFGPAAGVFATMMYTTGYLAKLQYETIEATDNEALEALSGAGVGKFKLIRFVAWPQAASQLIGQVLFMFEYNVRASSILGFVGAGGIGFYISGYLKFLEYDKVLTLLLMIFVVVVIIDGVSTFVRQRLDFD